jgi:hypothetical protein
MWKLVVNLKYGSQWGEWCSNGVNRLYSMGLWKFSMKAWEEFCSFTRYKVGDGSKVSFWHNVWCGMLPL